MKILSLFDGIACGYEALIRAGIKVDKYYASEIDKYAIQVAMKNHPDIIQVGDVTQLKGEDFKDIDMIIGGSPCQGFSIAGKQLNFTDPRSKLFFEYLRLVKEIKPKYFLLENVKMKKEFRDMISELLGVSPILIDSSLVSAQHRERYYWTNIPGIQQPKDKGLLLKDVLEDNVDEKYYISDEQMSKLERWGQGRNDRAVDNIKYSDDKMGALTAHCGAMCNTMKLIKVGVIGKDAQANRVYSPEGKSASLVGLGGGMGAKTGMGMGGGHIPMLDKETRVRKLTPIECERLQTLSDNYTEGISDSQRYKALGNGWTVDVIAHIFSFLID